MFVFILDVGYRDYLSYGFIDNVLNRYFTEYFPRSIGLSDALRDFGYVERFIYTTHPWLAALYLSCPKNFTLAGVKLKASLI